MPTSLTEENLARLAHHYPDIDYDHDAFIASYISQQSSLVAPAAGANPLNVDSTAKSIDSARKMDDGLPDIVISTDAAPEAGSGRKRKRIIDGLRMRDGSSPNAPPIGGRQSSNRRRTESPVIVGHPLRSVESKRQTLPSPIEVPPTKKKRVSRGTTNTDTREEDLANKPKRVPEVSLTFARRDQGRNNSINNVREEVKGKKASRDRTTRQQQQPKHGGERSTDNVDMSRRSKSLDVDKRRGSDIRSKFVSQTERLTVPVGGELLKRVGLFSKGVRSARLTSTEKVRNPLSFDESQFFAENHSETHSEDETRPISTSAPANLPNRPATDDIDTRKNDAPQARATVLKTLRDNVSALRPENAPAHDQSSGDHGKEAENGLKRVLMKMKSGRAKVADSGTKQPLISKYFSKDDEPGQRASDHGDEDKENVGPPPASLVPKTDKRSSGYDTTSKSVRCTENGRENSKISSTAKHPTRDIKGKNVKSTAITNATTPQFGESSPPGNLVVEAAVVDLDVCSHSNGGKQIKSILKPQSKPPMSCDDMIAQAHVTEPGKARAEYNFQDAHDVDSFPEQELGIELDRAEALLRDLAEATIDRGHSPKKPSRSRHEFNGESGHIADHVTGTLGSPARERWSMDVSLQEFGLPEGMREDTNILTGTIVLEGETLPGAEELSYVDREREIFQSDNHLGETDYIGLTTVSAEFESPMALSNGDIDFGLGAMDYDPTGSAPEQNLFPELVEMSSAEDDAVAVTVAQLPWKRGNKSSGQSSAKSQWRQSTKPVNIELPFSMPRKL
ncbi:hypothetical protein M427DRAFT_133437 [Gonapodya prolifera JEL478]|uniref:Uncharacterized protein n=1 Tax=Gonapodya prolifera (strain JEL478) TaxID=1344416 RepID=A0A139ALJ3_GONPJ|nr:hypothetical protein M427DRAFT_133437 [Gonapodya prolifera JEL478]|eukprot:KXS17647.1 hypothetical protein M427DRAFT_133437 [Gonapodya prolifera JEL478]